jgi:hypothetical protein
MSDRKERFVVVEQMRPTHYITDNKTIKPLKWEVIDRGEEFVLYTPNSKDEVIARFATIEEANRLRTALLDNYYSPPPLEKLQEYVQSAGNKVKLDIVSDGIDASGFTYHIAAGYDDSRERSLFAVSVCKGKGNNPTSENCTS